MQSAAATVSFASTALSQFSALPLPAAVLSNSSAGRSGSNPFVDKLDVDTTGIATQVDLQHLDPERRTAELARRVAAAWIHSGFALQPPSAYAGPVASSGLWDVPFQTTLHAVPKATRADTPTAATVFSLQFVPATVAPGRLMLADVPGCSGCCGESGGVGIVRLCAGVEPADMVSCLDTAVQVSADGMSVAVKVVADQQGTFAGNVDPTRYTTAVLASDPNIGCTLVTSTSNISVAASAIVIARPHRTTNRNATVTSASERLAEKRAANQSQISTVKHVAEWTRNTSGLFATPPMGWNAWNAFHCDVSERLIIAQADAMVASGLAAAGYQYLNLDDCWMVTRAPDGAITPDPVRFPSGIRAVTDYVHSKGLKFGIYQAPGSDTPQGRPGTGVIVVVTIGSAFFFKKNIITHKRNKFRVHRWTCFSPTHALNNHVVVAEHRRNDTRFVGAFWALTCFFGFGFWVLFWRFKRSRALF